MLPGAFRKEFLPSIFQRQSRSVIRISPSNAPMVAATNGWAYVFGGEYFIVRWGKS
jgi:hypothetical protein